jgi:hypothetical protein
MRRLDFWRSDRTEAMSETVILGGRYSGGNLSAGALRRAAPAAAPVASS